MKLPTGFGEHLFNKLFKKSSQGKRKREKEERERRKREREKEEREEMGRGVKNERIESNCLADCNENEQETS